MSDKILTTIKKGEYKTTFGKNGEVYAYTNDGEFIQSADTLKELEADLYEICYKREVA